MTRIEREKKTVGQMIGLYCHAHHKGATICDDCKALLDYAHVRLDHCRFSNHKPTCKRCPVHCYKPVMRQQMREVMRYSGPRMLWHHPIAAIRHLLNI